MKKKLTEDSVINQMDAAVVAQIKRNFKKEHFILSRIPLISNLVWNSYYNKTLKNIDNYYNEHRAQLFKASTMR